MYSMNLAAPLFKKSKVKTAVTKVLQICNIVLQLLIVILLISAFFLGRVRQSYENKSYVLKKSVFEQRNNKNIDETLRGWQEDYFKLSVIKKQVESTSTYGIALKELGNFLPESDILHAVAFNGTDIELLLKFNKQNLVRKDSEGKETNINYADVLKKQFADSVCFDRNSIKTEIIPLNDKKASEKLKLFDNEIKNLTSNPAIAVLKVNMKFVERKKDEK